jgi:hypothetical protein
VRDSQERRCGLRSTHTAADNWVPRGSDTRDARCGGSMASGPRVQRSVDTAEGVGRAEEVTRWAELEIVWPSLSFSFILFTLCSPFSPFQIQLLSNLNFHSCEKFYPQFYIMP